MLWIPFARKTRSSAEFSAFSLPKDAAAMPPHVTALQGREFDAALLLANAVASKSEDQDDHEQDNIVDFLPLDPWDDIDNLDPTPPPSPSASTKWLSTKPHSGPHCRRAPDPKLKGKATQRAKSTDTSHSCCARKHSNQLLKTGHVPPAAAAHAHVAPATPIATYLATSALPTALGAYATKVEDKTVRRGSKAPCSLTNLLGLGFQLIQWDGITPRPLLDRHGRIIAVLAGRPAGDDYCTTAAAAFCAIRDAGAEARFPASMCRHRCGLFAADKP
ncbi:hypothetical protein K438DRAFT_1955612 [Mycena galopus ATCC 62051]|nr:hypothetical protein K438DRAFT_1955612 [Mycena galopus ATCC 62051]